MENNLEKSIEKLEELQQKQSSFKAYIKDQLLNNPEYNKIVKDIEELNAKKKKIISAVEKDNQQEIENIFLLKMDIAKQKTLIADLTVKELLDGNQIRVKNKKGMILVPLISVKFRKNGDYEKPFNN